MAEITDTQALLADENPNILSDLNTGDTATTLTAPPAAQEATDIATNLSSQLYDSGVVSALEENRNAAIDELGQYDQMLSTNYNPFPTTPYYTPNPADMSAALAGMSGMTAQNTARIAGAVDTTERAYNTAIANVLDRFTNFQQLQQQQRQFEEQMKLERDKLALEREKSRGGTSGDFDMNAAMNALLGMGGTGEGDLATLMSDAAGGEIADTEGMKQMRLANAMRYARTPAEALQIKELYDLFYGNNAQQMTPEQLANATTLRTEFLSKTKDFGDSYDAYTKIGNLQATPAGDQTLLYNYIRLVDPGSFVTGNELATIENAAALDSKIRKLAKKTFKGTLDDKQRQDLKNQIEGIYKGREESYKTTVNQYAALADQYQVPRQAVIMNLLGPGYGMAMLEDQQAPFAGGTETQMQQQQQIQQKPSLQEIFGATEQTPAEQNRNLQEQEQRRPSIWESLGVYLPGNQRRVA